MKHILVQAAALQSVTARRTTSNYIVANISVIIAKLSQAPAPAQLPGFSKP